MRETGQELICALDYLEKADKQRAKANQTPDPDLVVYYIEHADWAVREALAVLSKEREET